MKKYLTIEIVARRKVKRERLTTGEFEGDWNDSRSLSFDFDFREVKKDWKVQITAWRKRRNGGSDEMIGVGEILVKDIQIDSPEPVQMTLYHPVDKFAARGQVSLIARHRIN
jgi:hypothetical protein